MASDNTLYAPCVYCYLKFPVFIELRLEWRLDSTKSFSERAFYLEASERATSGATERATEHAEWAKLHRNTRTCINALVYIRVSFGVGQRITGKCREVGPGRGYLR